MNDPSLYLAQTLLECMVLGPLLYVGLHYYRFSREAVILFLIAYAIQALQFYGTAINWRSNDLGGHIRYIQAIAFGHALPAPTGWQSQQPPLYYAIAALGVKIAQWLGAENPMFGARYVSRLFYMGFVLYGALTLRLLIHYTPAFLVALALLLFWPAAAHTGVKISNDIAANLFCAATFYYLCRWWRTPETTWLACAITASGLWIVSKSSGIAGPAMIGAVTAYMLWQGRIAWELLYDRRIAYGLLVLAICLACNFGRIHYFRMEYGADIKWLINRNNDYICSIYYVQNKLADYFHFSPWAFISQPYQVFRNINPEAFYFWSVFWRTLLHGSFFYAAVLPGQCINLCFLLGGAWAAAVLALQRDKHSHQDIIPYLLSMPLLIMMVLAARIMVEDSFQASARYVYGLVILLAGLYGAALERSANHRMLYYSGLMIAGGFIICSLALTLSDFALQIQTHGLTRTR